MKLFLLNALILGLLSSCSASVISPPLANRPLQSQSQNTQSQTPSFLTKSRQAALKWSPQAQLTGYYLLNFGGKQSLTYEFLSPKNPDTFYARLTPQGELTPRIKKGKQHSAPLGTDHWPVSSQEALLLAKKAGYQPVNNFTLGLNKWKGSGITQTGLKWSIMSLEEEQPTIYVVDALKRNVWTCRNLTATTGCVPSKLIQTFKQLRHP